MSLGTVVVVGPPLSGAGAVTSTLRRHLPGCHVTERAAASSDVQSDVVVFVVSAAAPMTDCDALLLDGAVAQAGAIVSAVTKIDLHRTWRETLEVNRSALARRAPRYRTTPWVGVAAAPQIGPLVIEPIVGAVRRALADAGRGERHRLRPADVRGERAVQLSLLRAEVRNTRLELGAALRTSVVTLRAELQHRAATANSRNIAGFDEQVRCRVTRAAGEFDALVRGRFAKLSRDRGMPAPPVAPAPPVWDGLPPPHRPATDQMTAVFAATFGLGVALTLARLAELAGGAFPWTLAGAGAVGIALAVWLARVRRLLAARAAADRWVAEVSAGLRSALEDRVLAAESSLLAAVAEQARSPN